METQGFVRRTPGPRRAGSLRLDIDFHHATSPPCVSSWGNGKVTDTQVPHGDCSVSQCPWARGSLWPAGSPLPPVCPPASPPALRLSPPRDHSVAARLTCRLSLANDGALPGDKARRIPTHQLCPVGSPRAVSFSKGDCSPPAAPLCSFLSWQAWQLLPVPLLGQQWL